MRIWVLVHSQLLHTGICFLIVVGPVNEHRNKQRPLYNVLNSQRGNIYIYIYILLLFSILFNLLGFFCKVYSEAWLWLCRNVGNSFYYLRRLLTVEVRLRSTTSVSDLFNNFLQWFLLQFAISYNKSLRLLGLCFSSDQTYRFMIFYSTCLFISIYPAQLEKVYKQYMPFVTRISLLILFCHFLIRSS